jgi:hypothetical protein
MTVYNENQPSSVSREASYVKPISFRIKTLHVSHATFHALESNLCHRPSNKY